MEEIIKRLNLKTLPPQLECYLYNQSLIYLKSLDLSVPFADDGDYLLCVEVKFCTIHQVETLKQMFRTNFFSNGDIGDRADRCIATVEQLEVIVQVLNEAIKRKQVGMARPARVLRVLNKFGLPQTEIDAYLLVLIYSAGVIWPNLVGNSGFPSRVAEYIGMTSKDVFAFVHREHPLLKEGMMTCTDSWYTDASTYSEAGWNSLFIKVPNEVIVALLRGQLTEEMWVKLTSPRLLEVLEEEEDTSMGLSCSSAASSDHGGANEGKKENGNGSEEEATEKESTEDSTEDGTASEEKDERGKEEELSDEVAETPATPLDAIKDVPSTTNEAVAVAEESNVTNRENQCACGNTAEPGNLGLMGLRNQRADQCYECMGSGTKAKEMKAYTSDLEYMSDTFKLIATLVKLRRTIVDIKEANTYSDSFQKSGKTGNSCLRELQGKRRLLTNRIIARLSLCTKWKPKVELLARTRSLSSFECLVLLLLVGSVISHDVIIAIAGSYGTTGTSYHEISIGYVLYVLCDSLEERVSNRSLICSNSRLVKDGIIRISNTRATGDLFTCLIDIDRRMLDYLVGLDTEFNEVVEGSMMYSPSIRMENVVLPVDQKDLVTSAVKNFDKYLQCKADLKMNDVLPYGGGLVILFHGPSGTGKTMLANAVCHEMGKKILIVDWQAIQRKHESARHSLTFVFREAKLNGALVFFDECDSLFESRERNSLVTLLLTELEHYEGLIMMATTHAHTLDEALHRRISLAVHFRLPDHNMRNSIWRKHIPKEIEVAEDVDFEKLGVEYELSGGLIKNAVLAALAVAVGREGGKLVIKMADLVHGAKLQLHGLFRKEPHDREVIPSKSLDSCVFAEGVRRQLREIVSMEKGRKLMVSQWGFEEADLDRRAFSALFFGPKGSGKSMATEAVAYELGNLLRSVDVGEVICKEPTDTFRALQKVFAEARAHNAIIVLDNADRLFSYGQEDTLLLLANQMRLFTRLVIVTCSDPSVLSNPGFALFDFAFTIQFQQLSIAQRKDLWKRAIPSKVPLGEGVDLDALAQVDISAKHITDAIWWAAAKAACSQSGCLSMDDLKEAVKVVVERHDKHQSSWTRLFA
jgi:SpoVK/Ycf46/Vps4 family AAA+-type ATPase